MLNGFRVSQETAWRVKPLLEIRNAQRGFPIASSAAECYILMHSLYASSLFCIQVFTSLSVTMLCDHTCTALSW